MSGEGGGEKKRGEKREGEEVRACLLDFMHMPISTHTYIAVMYSQICPYVNIHIRVDIHREREKEREEHTYLCMYVSMCVCMCMSVCI